MPVGLDDQPVRLIQAMHGGPSDPGRQAAVPGPCRPTRRLVLEHRTGGRPDGGATARFLEPLGRSLGSHRRGRSARGRTSRNAPRRDRARSPRLPKQGATTQHLLKHAATPQMLVAVAVEHRDRLGASGCGPPNPIPPGRERTDVEHHGASPPSRFAPPHHHAPADRTTAADRAHRHCSAAATAFPAPPHRREAPTLPRTRPRIGSSSPSPEPLEDLHQPRSSAVSASK
jgi:hypothetical protein